MENTTTSPLFPSTHPLAALPQDEAEAIQTWVDLALDGIAGWAGAIRAARSITEDGVALGSLTQEQADAIVEYTRSF